MYLRKDLLTENDVFAFLRFLFGGSDVAILDSNLKAVTKLLLVSPFHLTTTTN